MPEGRAAKNLHKGMRQKKKNEKTSKQKISRQNRRWS
jgi:hypothetical protein